MEGEAHFPLACPLCDCACRPSARVRHIPATNIVFYPSQLAAPKFLVELVRKPFGIEEVRRFATNCPQPKEIMP